MLQSEQYFKEKQIRESINPPSEATEIIFDETSYHAQKMESLGSLAGGMAHDMNNILASIMAVASAMDAEMSKEHPYANDVKDILNACKRGSKLTKSLLSFARRHRINFADIDINTIIFEVETILTRTISKEIQIKVFTDENLPLVTADPDQLNQVLMNICLNAVFAMGDSGVLTISTQKSIITDTDMWRNPEARPGPHIRITISDTGCGIPKDLQEKVFEPFFSTKPKGQGTGLGLAMAYGTIKKHKGLIFIDSTYEKGTSFIIDLPISQNSITTIAIKPEEYSKSFPSQRGTILLVDDEDLFLSSARRILEKLGYRVLCCSNGKEAIELIQNNKHQVSTVILDMIMPVMGGREAFFKIQKIAPKLNILMTSGLTEEENVKDILENGAIGFIAKPFDLQSLSKALPCSEELCK